MTEDPELERLRAAGKFIGPYVILHVATQLIAARYQGPSVMPSSQEWRAGVITESVKDALALMKLVLG